MGRPVARVTPLSKHFSAIIIVAKDKKSDENSKEADKMQNQDHSLQNRKQCTDNSVDNDSDQDTSPDHQTTMPRLRVIRRRRKDDQALNHSSCEETRSSRRSLPTRQVHPARDVAEIFRVSWWRKHGDPVVLASSHRGDRYEFAETREGAEDADPDEDVAVDETRAASVAETGSEVHEGSLPGDEDGAAEA